MAQMTIDQAIQLARRHQLAGQTNEAESIYRQVLALQPDHVDVLNLLGVLACQIGRPDEAADLLGRALRIAPGWAEAHNNLGVAMQASGRLDAAIESYRHAVQLKPQYANAYYNLGIVLERSGRLEEAISAYGQGILLRPDYADAHNNFGNALKDAGRLEEAIAAYGNAIRLKPDYVAAHSNLAVALLYAGRLEEAVASARKAVELKPDFAETHYNLGTVLQGSGLLDEAVAEFRRTIELKADHAGANKNIGNILKNTGKLDEAIVAYRRALEIHPNETSAHDNLILAMLYSPNCDEKQIAAELGRWNHQHAEPLEKFIRPHNNPREPEKRLRVGYVSSDFRHHVVGQNLLPLLREHDHSQLEVFCYANVIRPDGLTAEFQRHADHWRDIAGLPDARAAEMIQEDRIDILVDAALHTAGNRLLIFARKPAPVQVTFAGYPGSTGLAAIDYRLTDPFLGPPESDDMRYCEKSIRLPESFWCYDALGAQIMPNALPAETSGNVTFGCLNNFCKTNEEVLRLWARVLKSVDRSRLIMLCAEGSHRGAVLEILQREGIEPDRVELIAHRPREEYLELYHRFDVGLDTIPYNGHTTSLDSYWMGVPVVTLVGKTVVGRAGLSQLSNLGLTELVAHDQEQFVKIAADLVGDLPRLAELRRTLRGRMEASPLMDAKRFARNVEAACRQMWRDRCSR